MKTFLVFLKHKKTTKIEASGIQTNESWLLFDGDGRVAAFPKEEVIAVIEEGSNKGEVDL